MTGGYCIDEKSYEKIKVSKNDILEQLYSLEILCSKAIEAGKDILYLGI